MCLMRSPQPIERNEMAWIFWMTFALLLSIGLAFLLRSVAGG